MTERKFMVAVFSLAMVCITCVFAASWLEAAGRPSPAWLGAIAGMALGCITTLINPVGVRGNGNGTAAHNGGVPEVRAAAAGGAEVPRGP